MLVRRFFEALIAEKYYLLFACFLFLGSLIYGILFFDQVQSLMKGTGIFEQLEQVRKNIEQTPTFVNTFRIIFFNNVSVSLIAILSGFVFGVYPVMILVNNGLLISVVMMSGAAKTNIHPIILFLSMVLPHGIFELPAILIGAALGMHLGLAVIRAIIASFVPSRHEKTIEEWRGIRRRFPVIAVGMVVCLFFAALIETSLIIGIHLLK